MRARLQLGFIFILIIALGTTFIVTKISAEAEVYHLVQEKLLPSQTAMMSELAAFYRAAGNWDGVDKVFTRADGSIHRNSSTGRRSYTLVNTSREVIYSADEHLVGSILSETAMQKAVPVVIDRSTKAYLLPNLWIEELGESLVGGFDNAVNLSVLTAIAVAAVVSLLLSVLMTDQVIRPINIMIDALEQISQGDMSQRVPVDNYPQLGELGRTMNRMAASLQSADKLRRGFTADIAHELRTPLAVQQANIEALEDGVYPLTLESLKPIKEQHELLKRLVEDLRMLALSDSGELNLNKIETNLQDLVDSTISRFESLMRRRGVRIVQNWEHGMPLLWVDPDRIQQIFHNLLQNALRYTPNNTIVELTAFVDGPNVIVKVRDNGPGIPAQLVEQIFDRFFRVDGGRKREGGSTGLGLPIARNLALAHMGNLRAENHPDGGALFILTLPIAHLDPEEQRPVMQPNLFGDDADDSDPMIV